MKKQIIVTALDEGYQWTVVYDNEVIGFGYEIYRFEAFKKACAAYDKQTSNPNWSESEW